MHQGVKRMITSKITLSAIAAVMVLGACTDPRYQEGGDRERTGQGAAIGGLLGAAVGGLRESGNDRGRDALIGAAAGAIIGGAIGRSLDRQAEELRRDLGNQEITVVRQGNELVVRMPQDILFAVDSATVNPGLQRDLRVLADSLNRYPDTLVTVEGHTDWTGDAGYNQRLSERRAFAVLDELRASGVPSRRMQAIGRGESQPIATNQTVQGRALNRRVEITIQPTT